MIGFADDAIIMCPESNLELLEMKVNESLRRVKMWLESRKLQMASEKTEILLVTDKRSFDYPIIKINDMLIERKKQMTYLGVELDIRLSFRPHIHK